MKRKRKTQSPRSPGPDYNDPFQPPQRERLVRCLHCDELYSSSEIQWSPTADLWVCKNYPHCDGAGFGFDIHDAVGGEGK